MIVIKKASTLWKGICVFLLVTVLSSFLLVDALRLDDAQAHALGIPAPTKLLAKADKYDMPTLKGLHLDPQDPLKIDFILDSGNSKNIKNSDLELLVSYFLAAITVPQEDLWVNLSPYEDQRVIRESLGLTDMGRDLLAQDYVLKQLSSSLTHPNTEIGKRYWEAVDSQTVFNKIWITPDEVEVLEYQTNVLITEASFKLQTEADYLAAKENQTSQSGSSALKTILPHLSQQVNEGKHFARLRQIYNSLILGLWFKEKFKETFYASYIDQSKVLGIDLDDRSVKDKLYNKYLEAFQKGVYDLSKSKKLNGQKQKIRYFSGGISSAIEITENSVTVDKDDFIDEILMLPKEKTSTFSVKLNDFWGSTKKTVLTVLMSGLLSLATAGYYDIHEGDTEALTDLANTLNDDILVTSKAGDIDVDKIKASIRNTKSRAKQIDKILDYLVSKGHPKAIHDVPIVMLSGLDDHDFALYNGNHNVVVIPDADLSRLNVKEGAILLGHELIHALDSLSQSNIEGEVKAFKETWKRVVDLHGEESYEAKTQQEIYKGMERLLQDSLFVKEALGVEDFSAINYSGVQSSDGEFLVNLFEMGTDNTVNISVNLKTDKIAVVSETDPHEEADKLINSIITMDKEKLNHSVGTRFVEGDRVEFTVLNVLGSGRSVIVKFPGVDQVYRAISTDGEEKREIHFEAVVKKDTSSSSVNNAINGGIDLQDTNILVHGERSSIIMNIASFDAKNFKGFSFEVNDYKQLKSFEQLEKLFVN